MGAVSEVMRGGSVLAWWFLGAAGHNRHMLAVAPTRKEAQALLRKRGEEAVARLGATVEVSGTPPPPNKGCVLVYNETSFADAFAFNVAMWPHLERGSAADIFTLIPGAREAFERYGIALVPRKSRAAAEPVLAEMVASAKAGERISWGGEGRMSGGDRVLRFKVGSALIAIRAQVPLVPVAFWGGHFVLPVRGLRARPGPLRVRFGAPLSTEGLTEDDARPLADRAREAIVAMYDELALPR